MDQKLLWQASVLQKEAEEVAEKLNAIEKELGELSSFSSSLEYLSKTDEKTILSSLGKGVSIRSEISEKELFVEVGAGVVVKKSPEEVKKVVESQITKLRKAKNALGARFEVLKTALQQAVKEIEKSQKHGECNCDDDCQCSDDCECENHKH
jgi:prefoldin alpha subunit